MSILAIRWTLTKKKSIFNFASKHNNPYTIEWCMDSFESQNFFYPNNIHFLTKNLNTFLLRNQLSFSTTVYKISCFFEPLMKNWVFIEFFCICQKTMWWSKMVIYLDKNAYNSLNEYFMMFLAYNSCSLFNFKCFSK